jgi:uncharacterized protein
MGIVFNNPEYGMNPRQNAERLEEFFKNHRHAIVAYSGGVDSALLAYTANRVLGGKMVAALADSPSLSRREYRSALNFAQSYGIPLQIIRTDEIENPKYRANRSDRCYYCKQALFEKIEALRTRMQKTSKEIPWPVCYGVNVDDLGDHRPGIQAAREASTHEPYVELGFTKQIIRAICAFYKLEIADKPAMPCMASRIAYGEAVTVEKLSQVEKAEDFLYDLGLRILRVRHHGESARIEIPPEDFETLIDKRQQINKKFHELGFLYVSLDLNGFKSGSLNAVLTNK